ncbi:MORC family CW-type zinc finger protein 3a [Aulostomus maculatus]
MAQPGGGVPLSTLCPKFLHSNSTSHTWPFSAIAELIDNAYDPDVNAKHLWIDSSVIKEQTCLIFMDNGNGLDHEGMHKMLSFGYSDKTAANGVQPIGVYGNGFKSGSMRLGKDAIVFSKSNNTSCVGMLSQTYLEKIGAEQIRVPIVCFEQTDTDNFHVREEHKASLQDILRYSLFNSEMELITEIKVIASEWSTGTNGTRIIIWNLRRTSSGATEFDTQTDRYDIRIPFDVLEEMNPTSQSVEKITSCIPESDHSLRAYCSILYLKPRMQIIIRGQKVKTQLIKKSLAEMKTDHYKPTFLNQRIPITFGYNTKSKDQYGIMMYHKNRLIKAYERVGCQLKANHKGVQVIGVIECNFLEPTHNKQSFLENDKYRKTMTNLGTKLEEYWNEMHYIFKRDNPNSTVQVEDTMKRPDQNWVQCHLCSQWRKLPDGIDCNRLPDKWSCHMNPDPQFRSCQVQEEPEDSDDDQPSYRKTYKQHYREREDKKKQETKKHSEEVEQMHQEALVWHNEAPRWHENLERQLQQKTVRSPSTPVTPGSRFNISTPGRGKPTPLRSAIISQAACSPSGSNSLPVISDVCSLSPAANRGKRAQPVPQTTPKRPRVNGFHRGPSNASASVDASPTISVIPIDDGDETDDEIFILENASTPKPKKAGFDLTKVKMEERGQGDVNVGMLLECSDDAAVSDASEMNAAGSSLSPAPNPELVNTTTQTEQPIVKQEKEDEEETNDGEKHKSSDANNSDGTSEQRSLNQEPSEHRSVQTSLNRKHLDSDEDAGPSRPAAHLNPPNICEVQEQQDQPFELMSSTAHERDALKEQVQQLTSQLLDLQNRLQEETSNSAKKVCHHQASQTDEIEEEKDYRSLFEKANQKVASLIEDKEALVAAIKAKSSTAQEEEKDMQEIVLQVDGVIRELAQSNKERDELRAQLKNVKEEEVNVNQLRLKLLQQSEHTQEGSTARLGADDSSVKTDSDGSRSLIELRQNVGRLLVTLMPALDLSQVNFECSVIDEILEQYVSNLESEAGLGPSDGARNEWT